MKKYHVTLTDEERQQLQAIIAKRNAKSQAVKRAYVLLGEAMFGSIRKLTRCSELN